MRQAASFNECAHTCVHVTLVTYTTHLLTAKVHIHETAIPGMNESISQKEIEISSEYDQVVSEVRRD